MATFLAHLRSNTVAYLALFVALGGGAYAAATIDSGDVKNNSLRGADVRNNSLKGADVNERSLELSVAGADRDPDTQALDTFGAAVSTVELDVPARGLLLAQASISFQGNGGNDDYPRCQIRLDSEAGPNTAISQIHRIRVPDTDYDEAVMSLSASQDVSPGAYTVVTHCEIASGGTASAIGRELIVWTIPD